MPAPRPAVVHSETVCCGHKRCPTVELYADGTARIFERFEDGRELSFDLSPEQRSRLAELLST